jgi:hypothetical protein
MSDPPPKYIRAAEVHRRYGLTRTQLWQGVLAGEVRVLLFPCRECRRRMDVPRFSEADALGYAISRTRQRRARILRWLS